jgi:Cd2+/Zn2+-exporting ATPase
MAREPITSCAVCEVHADAVFRVEGMDCRDEVVLLERRLKPLPGVESLVADVVSQRLRVSYDAAKVSTSTLVDAAADAGLRMWLEHEEPKATGQGDARAWLTLAAAVALAGGFLAQLAGLSTVGSGLYLVAVGTGIVHPLRRARAAWRARALDINVLMVIAVAGALGIGEWLEAGSVVVLFAIAQWLGGHPWPRQAGHSRAARPGAARGAGPSRRPGPACRRRDPLVSDVVIVRPGDKVPVDGVVVAGRSDINEAALTGESMPVDKAIGAEVFAGTVNGHGSLDIRVSRVGPDTRMARITHLVEEAQARRAPLEAWVDRFGRGTRRRGRGCPGRGRFLLPAATRRCGCTGAWCSW